MKVKKIVRTYSNYGEPTNIMELNQEIKINLISNKFFWNNSCFQFKNIKRVGSNIFALENDLGMNDFCFKPKWYQTIKFYPYFYYKRLISFIKFIINNFVSNK